MDRRTFLSWVGVGWIASSLPVALVACSDDRQAATPPSPATDKKSPTPAAASGDNKSSPMPASPAAEGNKQRSGGFISVGTIAQLETGAIVAPKSAIGPVAVVRYQGNLVAVNPTCTHKGCVVDWQPSGEYVCPCHQAKFSATGSVTKGPATVPLKVYQAKIEGNEVLVKSA